MDPEARGGVRMGRFGHAQSQSWKIVGNTVTRLEFAFALDAPRSQTIVL
jgi:hypothetical protein